MNKRYPVYIVAILILVLTFGVMVKRAVSDVMVNNMRTEFCNALKAGDMNKLLGYVDTENPQAIRSGIARMTNEERENWAKIFESAKIVDQNPTQRTYQTYGMFDGIAVSMEYSIRLHQDGQWRIDTGSSLTYLQ